MWQRNRGGGENVPCAILGVNNNNQQQQASILHPNNHQWQGAINIYFAFCYIFLFILFEQLPLPGFGTLSCGYLRENSIHPILKSNTGPRFYLFRTNGTF
jgi:hypothetical protein